MKCVDCGRVNCVHAKVAVLKKRMKPKDGKGGPGFNPVAPINPIAPSNPLQGGASAMIQGAAPGTPPMPPTAPGMGISQTPGSLTPQQQMQMSAQGMKPIGAGVGPRPPFPQKISNKPHKSPRGSGVKKVRKAALKNMLVKHARRVGF